jgi:hypothetical protein
MSVGVVSGYMNAKAERVSQKRPPAFVRSRQTPMSHEFPFDFPLWCVGDAHSSRRR